MLQAQFSALMALLTFDELAILTGVRKNLFSIYIKRGTLVAKDGYIDDTNEINRYFIEKRKSNSEPKAEKPVADNDGKVLSIVSKKRADKSGQMELGEDRDDFSGLKKENLVKQNAKLHEEIEILKAKKERVYEVVIPREHAEFALISLSEGVKRAWHAMTEALITRLNAQGKLTEVEVGEIRADYNTMINESVSAGVAEGEKSMRQVARDLAGKKLRGEHE